MKQLLILFILALTFISCEEVVDLDLNTSQERLVIQASIRWQKGTLGNNQTIKLSKTTSFYNTQIVPATNAVVTIGDDNGNLFEFEETSDGIYTTDNFIPEIGMLYNLSILYNGETFLAQNRLNSVNFIDEITQSIEGGFDDSEPEINVFFTDQVGITNYYRIIFEQSRTTQNSTSSTIANGLYTDEFEDGNQLTDFYEDEDFLMGDEFLISVFGISEGFYNYLSVVEELSDSENGPFSLPPVNVRGNCYNSSDSANYPYGYFSLSEFDSATYIFQ